MASRYCCCLSLAMCVYICLHEYIFSIFVRVITHHPVQARITKFGPGVHNNLVEISIFFWGDWPWPSKSNWTPKSKFTLLWACPCRKSPPPSGARTTNYVQKMWNTLVKFPIVLGVINLVRSNSTSFQSPVCLHHFCIFEIFVRHAKLVCWTVPCSTWLHTCASQHDSQMHTTTVAPWTVIPSRHIYLVRPLEFSQPLTRRLVLNFTSY